VETIKQSIAASDVTAFFMRSSGERRFAWLYGGLIILSHNPFELKRTIVRKLNTLTVK
jgi:hypothetical protein